MARKLRLEYEGAVYHVISRGNYRADVFRGERTRAAFLKCLDEAARKAGWVVHAWAVMSNHYHLCLETPQPNLVEGMRWLQSTFSLRFNGLRKERGHVFQGRYRALLVEPAAIGAVCHYVHLNPVRAHLVPAGAVGEWRWTSLRMLLRRGDRPDWYRPQEALTHAGGLPDTPAGWKRYLQYLQWLQADGSAQRRLEFARLANDWAVGSAEFKKGLLQEHQEWATSLRRGEGGPRELSRELWAERLQGWLAAIGKSTVDLLAEAKGAPWKVAVAEAMKSRTTASNPWLAEHLNMGSPFRLSRLVTACRQDPALYQPYVGRIAKCKV
jgi:REP element-mobilizing transposase RayT